MTLYKLRSGSDACIDTCIVEASAAWSVFLLLHFNPFYYSCVNLFRFSPVVERMIGSGAANLTHGSAVTSGGSNMASKCGMSLELPPLVMSGIFFVFSSLFFFFLLCFSPLF